MSRYREMHDTPAIMCQHKKHIQDLEPDRLIRINWRTSFGTPGRPTFPGRIFHLQKRLKALRCQQTTVEAFIMNTLGFRSCHTKQSHIHNSRSALVNFGRFTER
jgi:hypothetical protein